MTIPHLYQLFILQINSKVSFYIQGFAEEMQQHNITTITNLMNNDIERIEYGDKLISQEMHNNRKKFNFTRVVKSILFNIDNKKKTDKMIMKINRRNRTERLEFIRVFTLLLNFLHLQDVNIDPQIHEHISEIQNIVNSINH